MSEMEVYKPEEIIHVIQLLETVQDSLTTYIGGDEYWDMLQEAIEILYYEEDEE
jgi:hypothetical protein